MAIEIKKKDKITIEDVCNVIDYDDVYYHTGQKPLPFAIKLIRNMGLNYTIILKDVYNICVHKEYSININGELINIIDTLPGIDINKLRIEDYKYDIDDDSIQFIFCVDYV